jgi:hypothetical protein
VDASTRASQAHGSHSSPAQRIASIRLDCNLIPEMA